MKINKDYKDLLMTGITKLFMTACILALQEQGKLSLEMRERYFQYGELTGRPARIC